MVGAVTAAVPGLSKGKEIIRPNIIDILADDLGYGDLSFFGQNKIATRNIDRLAKEGMVFTKHYS
jgi:arylsulfatase A-like enzyme